MRISLPYVVTVVIALLCVVIGHGIAVRDSFIFQNASQEVVRASVQGITQRYTPEAFDEFMIFEGEIVYFEARVTRGQRRGSVLTASQSMGDFSWVQAREVEPGDAILLIYNEFHGEWFFYGYLRTNRLLGLGVLFTLCILAFGGRKGFNTMLSLALTCGAVFGVFIPAILSGKNIYVMSLLVCAYTITMTLLLVVGFNKKAFAASVGCASGLAVTGIITVIMDRVLHLTGFLDEHSRHLQNLPLESPVDLRAIIFAGVIIGAMGAIMDVALSISSALWEIKQKAKAITFETLFRSGVTIGRDIMGSMANTLILAYIGTSLSVVLVLSAYSNSLLGLLNREMISVEILQSLAGILGILFAMPLTAFFCAVLYLKKPQ
ncbi:MAG: YibE/F family protein [Treponema sp.]|nr:YibE/F family protein [Treponema sp.]